METTDVLGEAVGIAIRLGFLAGMGWLAWGALRSLAPLVATAWRQWAKSLHHTRRAAAARREAAARRSRYVTECEAADPFGLRDVLDRPAARARQDAPTAGD